MTSKFVPAAIGITIFLVLGSLVVIILPALSTSIFAAPTMPTTPTPIGEVFGISTINYATTIIFTLLFFGVVWFAASRI